MKTDTREAVLISFSGMDGAGKSTQIANLCVNLERAGLNFRLLAFWDDVARLKSLREQAGHRIFKGDKGVGSPEAPIERRDKNVRSPLMTAVRLAMYVLDALSLRKKTSEALRSGVNVVIFDRYIYDELANLNLRNPAIRFYLVWLTKLVPVPQIAFILDADPVAARRRKPEYPLDFLQENRRSYLQLSDFLGTASVLPPLPLEEAKAELVRRVWNCPSLAHAAGPPHSKPQAGIFFAEKPMDGQAARPLAS